VNALAARLRAESGRSVDILAADLAARSDLLRVEHWLRQDPTICMRVNNTGVAISGADACVRPPSASPFSSPSSDHRVRRRHTWPRFVAPGG
jgi:hypothetical protein